MIKLLTVTTLYPNSAQPRHGIFVENRLRHLVASGKVETRIVAPIPWFPVNLPGFSEYSKFARVVEADRRFEIEVVHPKYFVIPKIGMNITPLFLFRSFYNQAKEIMAAGYDFDIIDAHYFYPDGVAAVMLGEKMNKPVVITARGTDINLIPEFPGPRKKILWAAEKSSGIITVCRALKERLVELGVHGGKIKVLRNGVDLKMFQPPTDRDALRQKLKIHRKSLLSVGHLIERKGHHLVVEAMKQLPDIDLYIAGDGPELGPLRRLVKNLGYKDRVFFLGEILHADLKDYYGAVDALVLASSREGWANVLLEAMACGTPVVATKIWGTPEVVAVPEAGFLAEERTSMALARAIQLLYANYPNREATRKYAEKFSWDATTKGQIDIFFKIMETS